MRIGELASRAGVSVQTIRYYEREGLIRQPVRGANNYREYRDDDVEQLAFIRQCRGLDMALEEIRTLLAFRDDPGASCETVNELLRTHLGHVQHRINELRSLEAQLARLQSLCQSPRRGDECGILEGLSDGTVPASGLDGNWLVGLARWRADGG